MSKENKPSVKRKIVITISVVILLLTSFLLYAHFIGTTGLVVKEYGVVNSDISVNFNGLKIVHISDIHYGRTVKQKQLDEMVAKINLLKPDVVVLSGDLIDRDTKIDQKTIDKISVSLKNIKVTLNKYAIMGNHDYKIKQWAMIIENGGFINLDDNYDLIYKGDNNPILITGVSTNLMIKTKIDVKMKKVNDFLATFNTKELKEMAPKYRILVIHEPDYIDDINIDDYDLILAGHSHNGQVRLPFVGALILPNGAQKYYEPRYEIKSTDLFISSGVGTSVLDLRFMNRPSINFYRLNNK